MKHARPLLARVELLYSRRFSKPQLSRAQLSIMITLEALGACRISQLAEAEVIHMLIASNAVHHLEVAGMVEHARDSKDRRGVHVELTDRGREKLHHVSEERNRQMAEMFSTLTQEELESGAGLETILFEVLGNYPEHPEANPGVQFLFQLALPSLNPQAGYITFTRPRCRFKYARLPTQATTQKHYLDISEQSQGDQRWFLARFVP